MAARRQRTRREHAAANVRLIFGEDLEADETAINEDGITNLDVINEVAIIHINGADFFAVIAFGPGFDGEVKNFSDPKLERYR